MRKLVLAALNEKDVDEVLLAWTDKEHSDRLDKLSTLLQQDDVINAGYHAQSVSFQRVLVPLMTLLSMKSLSNTSHSTCWKMMFGVISRAASHFFPLALQCIEALTEHGRTSSSPSSTCCTCSAAR
jgi:hypothetical protein